MISKTEVKPEKKRRLTPKQWAEAEALYESGEVTQVDLARRFKISEQAMHMHMKRNGIVRGKTAEEHKKRVAEEVTKAAIDDATIIAARIRETKEEHYKMSSAIAKMSFAEILKAKQDGAPLSVAMNNLKSLDLAMTVLAKARIERWSVLGLDKADYVDEDGLPELLISELTAEQIEALRARDHTELDDIPGMEAGDNMVIEEN